MRAEVKVAMIVGAVAICGFAIYWFSGDSAELPELDINKSTMDATAKDTSLAGDAKPTRPTGQRADKSQATQTPSRRQSPPASGERNTNRPKFQRPAVTERPTSGGQNRGTTTPVGTGMTPAPRTRDPLSPTAGQPKPMIERPETADKPKPAETEPVTITPGASGDPVTQSPPPVVTLPRHNDPIRPSSTTTTPRPIRELTRDATQKIHKIQPGDYLITIAETEYGDGQLWQAIKAANPGLDENRLKVGQEIKLPSLAEARRLVQQPAETTPATPPVSRDPAQPIAGRSTYVIERGDSLTKIATNVLGDGSRWREIYELNRDRLDSPDILEIGLALRMPPLKTD